MVKTKSCGTAGLLTVIKEVSFHSYCEQELPLSSSELCPGLFEQVVLEPTSRFTAAVQAGLDEVWQNGFK